MITAFFRRCWLNNSRFIYLHFRDLYKHKRENLSEKKKADRENGEKNEF